MNKRIHIKKRFFASLFIIFIALRCHAHDWPVHMRMTANAFFMSGGLNSFLNENLEAQSLTASPPQCGGTFAPITWLTKGSVFEDEQTYFGQTLRPLDHFYTVTPARVPGLAPPITDDSEGPLINETTGLGYHSAGEQTANSFAWAAEGVDGPALADIYDIPVFSVGPNLYDWPHVRDYEYAALTSAAPPEREENMALMLYSLGHVLHLNQDLSQPDHVRNDNHNFADHRYIENFGVDQFLKNPSWFSAPAHGWPYWRDQAHFHKLLDFWDRGMYAGGSAIALDNEATGLPANKLGLAEFSNGNFLGEDALYAEYFTTSDMHYFPFPSLVTSTTFPAVKNALAPYADVSYLKDGTPINRFYIEKGANGIRVPHHSVLLYMGVQGAGRRTGKAHLKVASTINDPQVLQDYHSKLLPKAIEYSAGILDYCFRGQISTKITWDDLTSQYTLNVRNDSGEDFQGGTFNVLKEDPSQIRSSVGIFSVGDLASGASQDLKFDGPITDAHMLVVVYKGTIGVTGGQASDPVDATIAVAITKQSLCSTPECWVDHLKIQTGDFTVSDQTYVSQQTASDYLIPTCTLTPVFVNLGNGPEFACVAWDYYIAFGVPDVLPDTPYCVYSADLTFADTVLHATEPWTGGPFSLEITSNDPRIQFSPSSVLIPTGFSGDIHLTVTQIAPMTIVTKGDLLGNCIAPTHDDWKAEVNDVPTITLPASP